MGMQIKLSTINFEYTAPYWSAGMGQKAVSVSRAMNTFQRTLLNDGATICDYLRIYNIMIKVS